jgi:endogenous inhibitor of DNA gyrase (YacG/DUF329 family)
VDLHGWFHERYQLPQDEEDNLEELEHNGNHPVSDNETP